MIVLEQKIYRCFLLLKSACDHGCSKLRIVNSFFSQDMTVLKSYFVSRLNCQSYVQYTLLLLYIATHNINRYTLESSVAAVHSDRCDLIAFKKQAFCFIEGRNCICNSHSVAGVYGR